MNEEERNEKEGDLFLSLSTKRAEKNKRKRGVERVNKVRSLVGGRAVILERQDGRWRMGG